MTIADVRLTHPDKVYYPDEGLTKRDLADYYLAVAERMLPHVAGRPLSIVRCPDGVKGHHFFQKHPGKGMLEGLKRVKIRESDGMRDYALIEKPSDLVELVQVGALEVHVWNARADEIEKPDRMVFDLDPDLSVDWKAVVSAARRIREFLEELGLDSFVKTTGGKGLHLVVPISRRHEWEYVEGFCRAVAMAIVQASPTEFVATMSKAKRRGKIFVDYLRNQRGATAVAAYSTRATPGAPLSMPITWDDLASLTSGAQFTLGHFLQKPGDLNRDPWSGIHATRQSLSDRMLKLIEA